MDGADLRWPRSPAGVAGIESDGNGNPLVYGTLPSTSSDIPGPVPASGEDFTGALIDNESLAQIDAAGDLGLVQWDTSNSGGTVLASPNPYTAAGTFTVSETGDSSAPSVAFAPRIIGGAGRAGIGD